MAIKINLLADQIANEELRRRDPVKRAALVSALLVILVLFYSLMLQFKVVIARSELATYETRLKSVEETSKQVKTDRALTGDVEKKIAALERFSRNRFLWGSALDAMQRTIIPSIRLTQMQSEQKYAQLEPNKFFTTNVIVTLEARRKGYGFSHELVSESAVMAAVSNQLKVIVKKPPFTTNKLDYATKIAMTATNAQGTEFTAKVEFSLPQSSRESTSLEIMGRDYGVASGALDDFTRKIASLPYLKERLKAGENSGINTLERPPQPLVDPLEPGDTRPFVPFTIECAFQDRVLSNE